MEIKSELKQPYTEKERINFIVEQNHKNGYEIRETETELQAWGKTEEEIQEQLQKQRNKEIDEKVKELYNMATVEMIKNNKENVDTYCSIINSLIECKS